MFRALGGGGGGVGVSGFDTSAFTVFADGISCSGVGSWVCSCLSTRSYGFRVSGLGKRVAVKESYFPTMAQD